MANFHRYYINVYIYKIIHSTNIDIFLNNPLFIYRKMNKIKYH